MEDKSQKHKRVARLETPTNITNPFGVEDRAQAQRIEELKEDCKSWKWQSGQLQKRIEELEKDYAAAVSCIKTQSEVIELFKEVE